MIILTVFEFYEREKFRFFLRGIEKKREDEKEGGDSINWSGVNFFWEDKFSLTLSD